MGKEEEYYKLTREDLDKIAGEPLPDRAAMSLISSNIAIPVNAAIAMPATKAATRCPGVARQSAKTNMTAIAIMQPREPVPSTTQRP